MQNPPPNPYIQFGFWLQRNLKSFAVVVALVLFVNTFTTISIYLLVAMVLALVLRPVVVFLTKRRILNRCVPTWLGAILALLLFLVVLLSVLQFFLPTLLDERSRSSGLRTWTPKSKTPHEWCKVSWPASV